MTLELSLDLTKFIADLEATAEAIAEGARNGMHDALDEWKREAVDIAPIDKGTLRRGIQKGEIEGEGANLTGEITSTAIESRKGKRFNYAYYIHEKDAGGKSLRTPGTVKRYLEAPLKKNGDKWLRNIEKEIEAAVKRKGW